MLSKLIRFLLLLPAFSKLVESSDKRNQIRTHFSQADPLIRLGLAVSLLCYAVLGKYSLQIPVMNRGIRALYSLLNMHNRTDYSQPVIEKTNCSTEFSFFDEIVIGSGPGGSIAAYESVKSGKKTLLIERGAYLDPNIQHHGLEQLSKYFLHGGQELILGKSIIPYAQGSVVGGGSEINSGLYHRLPEHLRKKWLHKLDLKEEAWLNTEKEIEKVLKIQKQDESFLGCYINSPIKEIAINRELIFECIPRWREYSESGFKHYGMESTYIQMALKLGLKVLSGHRVDKIEVQGNRVVVNLEGENCTHKFEANYVTLSAGTTETPRILHNSNLAKTRDFRFNFHAMTRLVGVFDRDVNDLEDIDPYQAWSPDYSLKIGAAVSTPPMLQATLDLIGSKEMIEPKKTIVLYASTEPAGRNGFKNLFGQLTPFFQIDKKSKMRINQNISVLKIYLKEVGAISIFGDTRRPSISTVHIFGSIPLGVSKLVNSKGIVAQTSGMVRVCDGSLLPTAPLVNPQGPVSVLCSILSQEIHQKEWKIKNEAPTKD